MVISGVICRNGKERHYKVFYPFAIYPCYLILKYLKLVDRGLMRMPSLQSYAGYCPQLKFTLGETYGKLTARLLSSPEVSRSRQLILYNSNAAPSGQKENGDGELPEEAWDGLPEFRRHPARMLPGYTGKYFTALQAFSRAWLDFCLTGVAHWTGVTYIF